MEDEKKINAEEGNELETESGNCDGSVKTEAESEDTAGVDKGTGKSEKAEDETGGEMMKLKEQIEAKDEELREYIELVQMVKAEFDNYKKRTAREKEQLYTDISGDIILKILPVIDNLERAVSSSSADGDAATIISGMEMILKQLKDILSKEGLEEIESAGQKFDPNYHNAVMHVDDESIGQNEIVEVFQKGYRLKDKIIRHSMVKVAN